MKNNANLAQARIDRAIKEEGDYYATHPSRVERFISRVSDKYELGKILEPACGGGHISMVLEDYLFEVESSDLFDRGFGHTGFNFLERTELFEGCGKNGDFSTVLRAINYAWFVFRKDFEGVKEVHII